MSTDAGNGRAMVLGAVRAALRRRGDEPGRRGQVRARLERTPDGIIPARARLPKPELIAQFRAMQEAQSAVVRDVATPAELPQAIADFLTELDLPKRLKHGTDAVIASLPWDGVPIEREIGAAVATDQISLSRAIAGAAETGTLFLVSGPENPSTLNFLPDLHLVMLSVADLAGAYEDAWARIRAMYGRGTLPRTVNMISGPSCTADIEQTLIRGAHGPRRLAIFLVS
jgi:L-lactate dehydrogenase complex protein LldG